MICLQVLKMKVPLKGLCVNWIPTLPAPEMPQSNSYYTYIAVYCS